VLEDAAQAPTILIVDDIELNRRLLKAMLKTAAYRILEAARPSAAIGILEREKVDLVVVDLVMPEMSGLAAARVISHVRPGTPVLLHTAFPTEVLNRESRRYGVRSVISKTDGRNLLAAIRGVVKASGGNSE